MTVVTAKPSDVAKVAAEVKKPRIEMVRPTYQPVLERTEARLTCDQCGKAAFVTFRPGLHPMLRGKVMREALEEHRTTTCTGGAADDRRLYVIEYARA